MVKLVIRPLNASKKRFKNVQIYGQILTLTKQFSTYLYYFGAIYCKTFVKICPYICTFLNCFLEAFRGRIPNLTIYDKFQIRLSLVLEKNLRKIEGGVPKIIDNM